MSSIISIYDNFLSSNLLNKIENEINDLNVKDYDNAKFLLSWLPKEIIKEKNVIKYSENISAKYSQIYQKI